MSFFMCLRNKVDLISTPSFVFLLNVRVSVIIIRGAATSSLPKYR